MSHPCKLSRGQILVKLDKNLLNLLRGHEQYQGFAYICQMKIGLQQRKIGFVVTCGFLAILPVLAYLQYTWLGQLATQESRQMRENVRTSAFHCGMDFGEEMVGLLTALGGPISGSDESTRNVIMARMRQWQSMAAHPHLVADSIITAEQPHPDSCITILIDEESSISVMKNLTSIVVPISSRPRESVYIMLNRAFILSDIIPEIITSNFSDITRSEYNIAVLQASGHLLWENRTGAGIGIRDSADAVVPFLAIPPIPLPLMSKNRLFRDARRFSQEGFERSFMHNGDLPPPSVLQSMDRTQGLFTLYVRHREGSLELAVSKNRVRNLIISLGILVLLGATVIFLLISSTRAQRLAQMQLEFVAGISHEFRTPLAVMKSIGENLSDGVVREEQRLRQYGDLIKNEVVRLSDLVEHSLDYAGIQSGNRPYEKQPIDVTDLVNKTIRKYANLPDGERPVIELSLSKNLPTAQGDIRALQSALENLLTNAIKYSPKEKWIGIDVHPVVRNGHTWIDIAVRDRGIGIPARDIGEIFRPFFRAGNAKDNQIYGSGLGLNIARHILQANGGDVTVESILQKGSIFTMRLPAYTGKG